MYMQASDPDGAGGALLVALTIAALCVLGLTGCGSDSTGLEVSGTIQGPYETLSPPEGRCAGDQSTPPITVESEGWSGTMSPKGEIEMSATFCAGDPTSLPTAVQGGRFTITTSDGDEIRGTMSGHQTVPFNPETGIAEIAFDLKVTGGTGQFKDASGLLVMPAFTGNGIEGKLLPSDFEGTVLVPGS